MESNELLTLKEMLRTQHSNKIPEPGFHVAKVLEASTEPNSRGTGSVFKLKLEITEGSDKGVIIKDSINILHQDGYTQKRRHLVGRVSFFVPCLYLRQRRLLFF